MQTLSKSFEKHLKSTLKKSSQTVRNYRADLKHFISWLQAHTQAPVSTHKESFVLHFNSKNIFLYRNAQIEGNTPSATTNRRLSSVRNFGKFLSMMGVVSVNPAEAIENIKLADKGLNEIVQDFEQYLRASTVSEVTVKNYLSDIRQFVNWLEKNVQSNHVVLAGQAAQQPSMQTEGGLVEQNLKDKSRPYRLQVISE